MLGILRRKVVSQGNPALVIQLFSFSLNEFRFLLVHYFDHYSLIDCVSVFRIWFLVWKELGARTSTDCIPGSLFFSKGGNMPPPCAQLCVC